MHVNQQGGNLDLLIASITPETDLSTIKFDNLPENFNEIWSSVGLFEGRKNCGIYLSKQYPDRLIKCVDKYSNEIKVILLILKEGEKENIISDIMPKIYNIYHSTNASFIEMEKINGGSVCQFIRDYINDYFKDINEDIYNIYLLLKPTSEYLWAFTNKEVVPFIDLNPNELIILKEYLEYFNNYSSKLYSYLINNIMSEDISFVDGKENSISTLADHRLYLDELHGLNFTDNLIEDIKRVEPVFGDWEDFPAKEQIYKLLRQIEWTGIPLSRIINDQKDKYIDIYNKLQGFINTDMKIKSINIEDIRKAKDTVTKILSLKPVNYHYFMTLIKGLNDQVGPAIKNIIEQINLSDYYLQKDAHVVQTDRSMNNWLLQTSPINHKYMGKYWSTNKLGNNYFFIKLIDFDQYEINVTTIKEYQVNNDCGYGKLTTIMRSFASGPVIELLSQTSFNKVDPDFLKVISRDWLITDYANFYDSFTLGTKP